MQDATRSTALLSSRTPTDKPAGPRRRAPLPRPEALSSRRNRYDLYELQRETKGGHRHRIGASDAHGSYVARQEIIRIGMSTRRNKALIIGIITLNLFRIFSTLKVQLEVILQNYIEDKTRI